MREVLISIQPRWVEKIVRGEKTVEVRKTRPKCELPFKCYIYCTKGKPTFTQSAFCDDISNGKVIGEFVCDRIDKFVNLVPIHTLVQSCLTAEQIREYLKGKNGYGWHITDLVVYDEPRQLGEFRTPDWYADCEKCHYLEKMRCPVKDSHKADVSATACRKMGKPLTRPPQSWCYIEPRQTAGTETNKNGG